MIKNFKWLFLVSLTFMACNEDDEVVATYDSVDGLPLTSGTADFSKYVALGDSFAAGFSDNALFIEGQKGAYPNILAQQFSLVGGGAFTTPFMNDNNGGFIGGTSRLAILGTNADGTPAIGNVPFAPTTDSTVHLAGPFNNMGIPGAKVTHLGFAGYAGANPYFGRIASTAGAKIIDDATAQNPTFFSLWIGGNDELGYATAGGDASVNPLTPTATFDATYNALVTQLVTGGRKGVIANLPYVTTLPYFRVIQYNQLKQTDLVDQNGVNQVANLNAALYGPLHNALAFLGQGSRVNLLSTTGNNPMIIKDETLPDLSAQLTAVLIGGGASVPQATVLGQIFGQARQTLPTDLICLSASSRIGKNTNLTLDGVVSPVPGNTASSLDKLGVTFPLPDRYILLPTEVAEIQVATDAYNVTIQNAANTHGLAFVNAKAIMDQLNTPSGITGNNFTMTANFVTGGTFSLDGVHPSPRGYALIANKFIEAINAKYGSNMKGVNLGNYRILFPANPANF